MALRLITEQEFRASRYGQVADQVEGRLSDLIEQAEAHIEHVIDRRLKSEQYTELSRPLNDRIFVQHRPIITLDNIYRRTDDDDSWVTLSVTDFEVRSDAGVLLAYEDNVAGYTVKTVYTAGYATIPWDIKAAAILQTVIFAYQDLEVYGVGDAKVPGIVYLQEQVDRYLMPYRKAKLR